MKNIQSRIKDLSPERRVLLEKMLKERKQTSVLSTIRGRQDLFSYPLSFAQQRLWFLEQLRPGSPMYNIYTTIRLKGSLDIVALEGSLGEIVRRHDVLRSTFSSENGHPLQHIAFPQPVHLRRVDLTVLPLSEREAEAAHLAVEESCCPFDLAIGPLFRASLLILGETEHHLLLTMHHIVSDGWSMGVFVREIGDLYNAFVNNKPSPLPELPIQYADYAQWQREWLEGDVLEKQLDYWKKQLAGAPPVLALPTDHPRSAIQTDQGATSTFVLSAELTSRLKDLSQREGVTLFMTLLAAFQTLLYRYTSQTDIVVGSPIANRTHVEIEGLIGFFINTLVLRSDLSNNPTFCDLLKRVRTVALGAYAHQDLPFEKLVEELNPTRDLSHAPLFQVMFVFQNTPMPNPVFTNLDVKKLDLDNKTSKYDLLLSLTDETSGLVGYIEYNTSLFNTATITLFEQHFKNLLEAITNNPTLEISVIPILSTLELKELRLRFYNGVRINPNRLFIHQLIEEQARLKPNNVAVVFEGEEVSYDAIDRRANCLANYLQVLGVGPEVRVGIFFERSIEMIVGILAIIKAGGVYVPLDSAYPLDRLSYILEEIKAPVILTQKRLVEALPKHDAYVICIDDDLSNQYSDISPESYVTDDNLLYVIYTSGSTGSPKGVMNTHKGLLNRILWMQETYHLTTSDSVLQKTPYSFDVSVWEFLWPLMAGARLIVAKPNGHRDSRYLVDIIRQYDITTLHFVPSMLRAFLDEPDVKQCSSIKRVICSGEALPKALQDRFIKLMQAELHNLYGPTEASIDVTAWKCNIENDLRSVPIGYPITNIEIFVLDTYLNPVPLGVTGELYIGGIGLARGYLNRPELTAERFIPHHLSTEPGERLYKTGDLGRFLPDGSVEFLGRIDNQVKVRGYRIELSEIEEVLRRYTSVQEVAVITLGEQPDLYIVAYVLPVTNSSLTEKELHSFLVKHLPDYMIPFKFVIMDTLPLMTNGKVDRKSLPIPSIAKEELSIYMIPTRLVEETLALIWSIVLKVNNVGVDDNYFSLGGDSIRSLQIITLASSRGLNFTLQDLFEHPTIRELAQKVKEKGLSSDQILPTLPFSLIAEIDRQRLSKDVIDAYPLSVLQAGMFFENEYTANYALYHDVFSFRVKGKFDVDMLSVALNQLVARHPVLRTSFDLVNFSVPVQLVHSKAILPLQVNDISMLPNADQENIIKTWMEREKKCPFDWRDAPLVRVQIYVRSPESFQFGLSCHNSILDGWSIAIMFTELFKTYLATLKHETIDFQPLRSSVRDFVALEQSALASQESCQYWLRMLPQDLVIGLPRRNSIVKTKKQSFSRILHVIDVPISESISLDLHKLAQSIAIPVKSVLLAVHARILSLMTGQKDVITGLVSNGRPEGDDGERILGLFLNVLPFRITLSGGTWVELIQEIFELERGSLSFRRYPISQLQVDSGRIPMFEATFNFIHFHVFQTIRELDGLEIDDFQAFDDANSVFWVEASVDPFTTNIHLQLRYDATELDDKQVESIRDYYSIALAGLVNNPFGYYEHQSLLSELEQNRLIADGNGIRGKFFSNETFIPLFESQVRLSPALIAVKCGIEHLTYSQLNSRANHLARVLVQKGIGPEVVVALLAERGIDYIVFVLAILKVGGVYLPLDPSYPILRIGQILDQSHAQFILVTKELGISFMQVLETANSGHSSQILVLDEYIEDEPYSDNLSIKFSPSNLAYIIYTSGSTGVPKGVMVEHNTMLNHFYSLILSINLNSADIIAQSAAQGYVISIWQSLAILLVGGQVCILPEDVTHDPRNLIQAIEHEKITILEAVPSLLKALLDEMQSLEPDYRNLAKLRWVMPTGEVLPIELCRQWLQYCPNTPLLNAYGAAECSDDVTIYPIFGVPSELAIYAPIGRPLPNMRVYVLDKSMSLCPTGVIGELYIGGACVSRGYLNDAVQTANQFVPDPFSTEPGSRFYRTGDLGRILLDGNIEVKGRVDQQIKVRGFRVEPREIEIILEKLPSVKRAIVATWKSNVENRDDIYLIAYIVPTLDSHLKIDELRNFLDAALPRYMIPSAFHVLHELPLLPNGKINRKALPPPDFAIFDLEKPFIRSHTPVEEILVSMWVQVLGLTHIGTQDHFFYIGGHSLLATQLASRIQSVFQIEFDLRTIFEAPTIAELAKRVEASMANKANPQPLLNPIKRTSDLDTPLSYAQQRLWFYNQLVPDSPFYNLFVAVRLIGYLDINVLKQSFIEVTRRHQILRSVITTNNGQPRSVFKEDLLPEITEVDLRNFVLNERDSRALQLMSDQIKRSFNLSCNSLLRVGLFRVNDDEYLVVLTIHHIIADAWSIEILLNEVAVLYSAYLSNQPSPLKDLQIQYSDFAKWQREWLQTEAMNGLMAYWRNQLEDAPEILELPTDFARPKAMKYQGSTEIRVIDQSFADVIKIVARQEGVTLFMILLAALQILLKHDTESTDIIVGTDIANRNRTEAETLIGFFVNQLVLRCDLSGNPTFRELLKRVRRTALDAYAHQDLPFDKLVEALNPVRSLNHSPLFQIKLVLQNAPTYPMNFPGIKVNFIQMDRGTAQLDLNLRVIESESELIISTEYNTELFNRNTIVRFIERFELVLQYAVSKLDDEIAVYDSLINQSDLDQLQHIAQNLQKTGLNKLQNISRKKIISRK